MTIFCPTRPQCSLQTRIKQGSLLSPITCCTAVSPRTHDQARLSWVQVLLEDCSEADVAEQASGVVEAVLQGRNSLVLALGQAGSGKSHTMLGGALHDVDASSSTGSHCVILLRDCMQC